jgi:dipeptidyl-peptidase-4
MSQSISRLKTTTGTALLIIFATALLGTSLRAQSAAEPFLPTELDSELRRIFSDDHYEAATFGPARWLDEGDAYTTVEPSTEIEDSREIIRYDTRTGQRSVLVSAAALRPAEGETPLETDDYEWSSDRSRLLLFTNTRKVWRRNTRGDYWVLELASGALHKLGGDAEEATLMFAKFTPDGKRVGYVRNNDIYVENLADDSITRLTDFGSKTIINGTSDWVYEEEFGVRDGFSFSPDGSQVAFFNFDSEGVGNFRLIDNTASLYPEIIEIPYPKVGTTNSAVRIGVVPASGGDATWLDTPGDPRNTYIARMEWFDDNTIALQHLNRLQNRNQVLLGDARSGTVQTLYTDQDDAWVDVRDFDRLASGDLLWLSERSGWRSAYVIDRNSGTARTVTTFDADVLDTVGVATDKATDKAPDKATDKNDLYFLASPDDATSSYLYRSSLDPSRAATPERLTPADQPGWHTYDLSPDGKWAFHTWSRFEMPPRIELIRLPSHDTVRVLEDNSALKQRLTETAAAAAAPVTTEFLQLEIEPGVKLDGWKVESPSPAADKSRPLLVFVYGEPAAQTVTDRWGGNRMLFHQALARQGFVVTSFDNRGTPAPRGREWRKQVYGVIGELSASDQAAAVRALLQQRPDLDPERVSIWGWSGGGSNTLNAMFRHPQVFKTGVSVAPVPDQTLYDTIYQERYMGLPDDNAAGYRLGSPIHHAEGLAGHLLIVHGSGDDNVHYQGTERLVNRLIELAKPFDLMVYPNRSHSISEGEGTSLHLHSLIARYLLQHNSL